MVIFPPPCFVLIYGSAFLILTRTGINVTKNVKRKTENHKRICPYYINYTLSDGNECSSDNFKNTNMWAAFSVII